jgi:hypothetical protein
MFRFVTIIPLEFWAIVPFLLFIWAAFGLWGMVATVVGLALTESGRIHGAKIRTEDEAAFGNSLAILQLACSLLSPEALCLPPSLIPPARSTSVRL